MSASGQIYFSHGGGVSRGHTRVSCPSAVSVDAVYGSSTDKPISAEIKSIKKILRNIGAGLYCYSI